MSEPQTCPTCGEPASPDANWCEACGSDLAAPVAAETATATEPAFVATAPCVSCQAPVDQITEDGWCQLCGTKQPDPGDHVVNDLGVVTVVSDRGRKHGLNEDAGAVGLIDDRIALVVCDGVSSTEASHHASQAAATVAVTELLDNAPPIPAGQRLVEAAAAAQAAVVEATPPGTVQPPSCTFVAALAEPEGDTVRITVGWLGDSRAYWLDDEGARLLTRDHIWAVEQRTLGMPEDEIAADPRAHSITRWLGEDAVEIVPEVVEITVTTTGLLLVCSDGLWNYFEELSALAALVANPDAHDPTLLDLAERLVAAANELGGHDNITVALARLPLPPSTGAETTGSPTEEPDAESHASADTAETDLTESTESTDETGS